MNRTVLAFWVLGLAAGAVAASGCTGGDTLQTEYVEGLVTVDGEPVPEATVAFIPVDEDQGTTASGMTDANGIYRLTAHVSGELTARPEGGTTPGEYYVSVRKSIVDTPMSAQEAEELGVAYEPAQAYELPQAEHVVPQRYNDPRRSGLTATVEPGKNTINFELTSN